MSWQVGSFLLLGLALVAGFAWYERVRPDARIVALVATLAAFAALGRIAFAAVPNVKPTTDIVLVAGYALGGGPGFAVGALAGLASNFFFGQGPWTPWQMAAWGATGVVGAMLAVATGWRRSGAPRPIGRTMLAVVCGLAGFAFTVVQDIGDWVTYSDHSARQLGAYVGQGLGFDAIHAVGCVAFALVLGPALITAIQRFTRRLQVRWVAPGAGFPLATVLIACLAVGLPAPSGAHAAARPGSPVGYLRGAENHDGGFGPSPGQASAPLFSGWAALGLAAAHVDPLRVGRDGHTVIGYITARLDRLDLGSLERTILVARAAGLSARSLGGHDLLRQLEARRRPNGSFGGTVNLTAFAVLALRSAAAPVAPATIGWLTRQQNSDGGYGFAGGGSSSDSDDTGAALEALAGEPGAGQAVARAVDYLRGHQDGDGGFAAAAGAGSNAQSTAWAVQGLIAAGVDPAGLHRHGTATPLTYLRSLIDPRGAVAYARGQLQTPVWVTGEALMALRGQALPVPAVTGSATPGSARAPRNRTRSRSERRSSVGRHAAVPHRAPRRGHRTPKTGVMQREMLRLAAGTGLAIAALLAPLGAG